MGSPERRTIGNPSSRKVKIMSVRDMYRPRAPQRDLTLNEIPNPTYKTSTIVAVPCPPYVPFCLKPKDLE